MRDNIDLTANRMFQSHRRVVMPGWVSTVLGKYPWNKPPLMLASDLDNDILHGRNIPLIVLGNKSDRHSTTTIMQIDSGEYCDCCGAYLNAIPWDRTYGLCRKCMEDMRKNYGNRAEIIPWYHREEMRPNRERMYSRVRRAR